MSWVTYVRSSIRDFIRYETTVWNAVIVRSDAYMQVLQLNESDLQTLERVQGYAGIYPTLEDHANHSFLQLDIEGLGNIVLYVKYTCLAPYGKDWRYCVMAFSTNRPELNIETGHGTSHIIALKSDAHNSLLKKLAE